MTRLLYTTIMVYKIPARHSEERQRGNLKRNVTAFKIASLPLAMIIISLPTWHWKCLLYGIYSHLLYCK